MTDPQSLLQAAAVRERCGTVMRWVEDGHSAHFTWHPQPLADVAAYVIDTTRTRYPDLAAVPFHSRWRHFEAGGVDRWAALTLESMKGRSRRGSPPREATAASPSSGGTAHVSHPIERARTAIDLVIPSVLLDAGAGPQWCYLDAPTGQTHVRSEGLGIASLRWFERGAWSGDGHLRTDAAGLQALRPAQLEQAFQVSAAHPLVGSAGRITLLQRLGAALAAQPEVFGPEVRLGRLFDHLQRQSDHGRLPAATLLHTLLSVFGRVWPGRAELQGVPLGDCWHHPALPDRWVPFHKLTQWLAYSLLEPLAAGGVQVTGLDALTGLPEYRNGGLLLDFGLLRPRDAAFPTTAWQVHDEPIVEWRAVTVTALDRIAAEVRRQIGLDAAQLPLARVLEGGTWAAGRRIAATRRPGGAPPLTLHSDGTVF